VPTRTLTVNVFERDPGLLADLQPGVAEHVASGIGVEAIVHNRGPIDFGGERGDGIGLLIVEGFVCREATVAGRTSVELLGRGHVLRPWDDDRAEAPVPVIATFRAMTELTLAKLDRRFVARIASWPEILDAICARLVDPRRWLALQLALTAVRRIDDRLLVLLWHIADRWGRVERDGTIVCPLPVTHQLLAGMLGTQRPSVTSAFAALGADGRIAKHQDGWALLGDPPTDSDFEARALADAFRLGGDG
jgi:CRP-like cAMP-binding protein